MTTQDLPDRDVTVDQRQDGEPTVVYGPSARLAGVIEQQLGMDFHRLVDRMWQISCGISRSRDDAKELFQEAFLRLCRTAAQGSISVDGSSGGYVARLIRNTGVDLHREATAERRGGPDVKHVSIAELEDPPDRQPSPSEYAEGEELKRRLDFAIQNLPEEQRIAVRLLVQSRKSKREIADMLGIPVTTLHSRIRTAQRLIRAELRRYGWEVEG